MGDRETHYEIYLMKGKKGSWNLHQAFDSREEAINAAKSLHEEYPGGSVRVEKEIFDGGERTYNAVTVFQLGESEEKLDRSGRDDRITEPPCAMAEDLWTLQARLTIARVLDEWLLRERATPLELMHRADLAEKLDAAGTTLQHAIQKTAIAQAAEYDSSVQHFVKCLNELSEKAIGRVLTDEKQGRLPKLRDIPFAKMAEQMKDSSSYRRCALIADALNGSRDWKAKIKRLVDLAALLPDSEETEPMMADLDAFMTEILNVRDAADSLAQGAEDHGDILDAFVDTVMGKKPDEPGKMSHEALRLGQQFGAKRFIGARAALARRVLDDLKRPARLKPDDVWGEVRLSRSLADRLIVLAGADFPVEETAEAFIYRSGCLVAPEVIEEALEDAETCCDALERLMRLETAIAGEPSKRKLASYFRSRLASNQTETEFLRGPAKPLERLAMLTALQRKAMSGGFCQEDKDAIATALDRLGERILAESKIFNALETRPGPKLDNAQAMLRLAVRNILPEGQCKAEAAARAQRLLREAMRAGEADPSRLTEIRQMLTELAAEAA